KDSKTKYQYEEDNEERKLKGVRRREKSEDYKKYSELSKSHSSNDDKNSRRQHAEESNKSPKIRHEPKDSRSKKELQGSSVRETCEASSIDSKKAAEKTTEEYNYDDDEFEDYSDDFDDSSSDNKENEDQSNERTPSDTEGPSRERSPESTEYLHHSRDPQKNVADVKSNYPRSYATMEVTSTLPRIFNKADVIRLNWRPKLLTKLILLDTSVEQELFEMSPTSQYELYIRNFGQANYKQAFVQTGYDSVDRDIQTEECEMHDKWTQHPPIGRFSSGGNQPNRSEGEHQVSKPKFDSVKLHKFLFHATRVMAVLLEEELPDNKFMIKQSENSSQLNFCSGYFTLGTCPIFGNQSVSHCCCTSNNFTDFLMTTHNNVKIYKNKDSINGRNFLGIWDLKQPSKPSKILSSESQINNCCFGPSNSKLVCAGCEDGSILLWDTREAESLHQSVQFDGASYTVRLPAYNTAGVMLFNCHQAPIQSVCHVPRQSYSLKDASQLSLEAELSFQLLSMDCVGVINIWVVVALTSVQLQGSLTELGLKPGSKVKLVHSSTVNVQNPLRNAVSTSVFQTHQLCLLPHNPNQIYIATDTGHVVHSVRLGTIPYPRVYYPTKICDTGAISEVLTIDFTPFKLPCFLTGYSDGNIHLYHTSREYAINSWPLFMTGVSSITQVRWSKTRPCVFYVIADHSVIFVFDLLQHHNKPVHRRTIENRITAMELFCNSSEENDNIALNEKMILCLSSGKTEIQTLSTPFSQPQHLEWEFLEKYLERF
ncbi:WD repeat-containing protein 60-like, partial [Argonauta hians]